MYAGNSFQLQNKDDEYKLEYAMARHKELADLYILISQLSVIALKRGLKMVIENPYNQPHYLTMYWCLKPSIIDKDRTQNGDYYKKPTQYWFINCEPKQNLVFEPIEYVPIQKIEYIKKIEGMSKETARSMIHPQYAERFIKKYLIDYQTDFSNFMKGE